MRDRTELLGAVVAQARKNGTGGTRCALLLLCALGMALPGCKSTPSLATKPEAAVQRLAEHGYRADAHYDTATYRETWLDGETPLDVSVVEPTTHGPFPLIIYLPGLGESAAGGALWRTAWAEAGYSVLTVQPAPLGESALRSEKARAGDFRGLAKEHFSAASLKVRIDHLSFAVLELKRRAGKGLAPYSVIDTRRVALAGFDLGAQTTAALVGEKADGVGSPRADWSIRAAVLLSPYVDLAAPGGVSQRFAAISIPVLSVTGTEDADPFGLVSSPGLRRAPWQSMPAGDKYLLLLSSGSHRLLAGVGYTETGAPSALEENEAGQGGNADSPIGAAKRSRHGAENANRGGSDDARGRPFDAQQIAAVRIVTTAFLDATVRDDPVAREWLAKDAPRWLGESAHLQVR